MKNSINICDTAIIRPLSIIRKNCIELEIFPSIQENSNIVSVHKKGDKQIIGNYRPISMHSIIGKIFEKMLFTSIFEFLNENNFVCANQSGFRSSDSCECQFCLLYIIYINLLTVILQIFLKSLIGYDMRILHTNLNVLG